MEKKPKKRHLQPHVHAEEGEWKVAWKELRNGEDKKIVGFNGYFDKADRADAFGAARHFTRSLISLIPCEPVEDGNRLVIHLTQKNTNFEKFYKYAIDHHLLKDPQALEPFLRKAEARAQPPVEWPITSELAYRPLANDLAKKLLMQTTWEQMEGAGWGQKKEIGRDSTALVFTTDDPLVAFHVALYLKNKNFIPAAKFWEVNDQIQAARMRGHANPDETFRIGIAKERSNTFIEKFPDTGIRHKIDAGLLAVIEKLSREPLGLSL